MAAPIAIAGWSPLLAWRDPVYIAAGFAGIAAMALIVMQPLLAMGYLPGFTGRRGRQVHRWTGAMLVLAVALHVAGLWLTSPPDVHDALLFRSPTPFSVWGVVAMWALLSAAILAVFRRRIRPRRWRLLHKCLVSVAVIGSVVHAMLIQGTMGRWSKTALCALAVVFLVNALFDLRARARPRG